MDLRDAVLVYFERFFPMDGPLPPMQDFSPEDTALLLYENAFLFTARHEAINAVPYDAAFDEEADGALIALARFDNFDLWDEMSASGWRVMLERWTYAMVVAGANAVAKNPVMIRLPQGLDHARQARAALIMLLTGGARTIDPRLLARHAREGLPRPTPAATRPIRKN